MSGLFRLSSWRRQCYLSEPCHKHTSHRRGCTWRWSKPEELQTALKKKVVLSNFQFAIFSWFSLENKAWAIMACHCCPEEMLSLLAFVNGTKYERAGLHPCKGCLWALFHGIPTASCLSSHLGTNSLCAFLRTVGFFQPALPCWYWLCSGEANF